MQTAVFDARWILPTPSGIGVYARELAMRLPALLPDRRFVFLVRPDVDAAALVRGDGRASALPLPYGPLSPKNQARLPRLLRALGAHARALSDLLERFGHADLHVLGEGSLVLGHDGGKAPVIGVVRPHLDAQAIGDLLGLALHAGLERQL